MFFFSPLVVQLRQTQKTLTLLFSPWLPLQAFIFSVVFTVQDILGEFDQTDICVYNIFLTATSTGLESLPRPARPPTSEEVQAKLAAHAESLRKQAQDAASMLNLPSYLNPSVVNPHQYAVQAQKRKLLWSGKKTTEVCVASPPPPSPPHPSILPRGNLKM